MPSASSRDGYMLKTVHDPELLSLQPRKRRRTGREPINPPSVRAKWSAEELYKQLSIAEAALREREAWNPSIDMMPQCPLPAVVGRTSMAGELDETADKAWNAYVKPAQSLEYHRRRAKLSPLYETVLTAPRDDTHIHSTFEHQICVERESLEPPAFGPDSTFGRTRCTPISTLLEVATPDFPTDPTTAVFLSPPLTTSDLPTHSNPPPHPKTDPWNSDNDEVPKTKAAIAASSSPDTDTKGEGKIYTCPYKGCGRTATRAHNMASHIVTHTGERPYICEDCKMAFGRKHDLSRHERIHSRVKPHICDKCGKGFARLDALRRHESTCPKA